MLNVKFKLRLVFELSNNDKKENESIEQPSNDNEKLKTDKITNLRKQLNNFLKMINSNNIMLKIHVFLLCSRLTGLFCGTCSTLDILEMENLIQLMFQLLCLCLILKNLLS